MSSQTDLRVIKTQEAIKTAFLQLISKKGFVAITINDIAQQARINRSTFYLHYTDKYALLNQLTTNGIARVATTITPELHITDTGVDYTAFTQDLNRSLSVVAGDPVLYTFILNDPAHLGLRQRAEDALKAYLDQHLPQDTQMARDLLLEIVPSIYLAAIRWWLAHDMKYSPQFLAQELAKFFELGSRSIIDSDSH